MGKGNSENIRIVGHIDILLFLLDPFDFIQSIRLSKICIVADDLLIIRGPLHEVTEVVDHLPNLVAAIFVIRGNFGHSKVRLR